MPFPPRFFDDPPAPFRHAWRWVAAAAGAALLMALLGPFGPGIHEGERPRLIYGAIAALAGLVNYGTTLNAADRAVGSNSRFWWPAMVGAAMVASVPQTLVTRGFAFRLWPDLARQDPSWLAWYARIALIGLVATLIYVIALRRARANMREAFPIPTANPEAAPSLPATLIALQMEDHYVRVHSIDGSELRLMPLGHAIAAAKVEGLQVHRSWWVARSAVAAVEGNPRSMRLRLTNGIVAPVARSAVARLRAAGWIAG